MKKTKYTIDGTLHIVFDFSIPIDDVNNNFTVNDMKKAILNQYDVTDLYEHYSDNIKQEVDIRTVTI